jgi:hypothetical protein
MEARATVPDRGSPGLKQASSRGVTIAARVGYATHGLVYGMIGTLALLAALGQSGGKVTDSHGAVNRIGRDGWGEPLLWAVAIGLACYALWSGIRALLDPEHNGRNGKGLLKRAGFGASAITHGVLATYTFQLAHGAASSDGGHARSVGQALSMPGGRIGIGIVGLLVIGFGLVELYRAIKDRVGKELSGGDLPARRRELVIWIARAGVSARGVVFPIIGSSLIVAAMDADPGEAGGFGGALRQLASQPFGSFLLGVVAVGLVAYGVYQLCLARYARIRTG